MIIGTVAAISVVGTAVNAHIVLPDYDLPAHLLPQDVAAPFARRPYEIHVYPEEFALYWTLPGFRAIRYIVTIGQDGLYEPGEYFVAYKREWPRWTPTPSMLRRNPERFGPYAGGMPGGLNNPLGARALYLFTPERGDTYLRIHGTNDPESLGQAVSQGCARLINDQVIDLYERVPNNTRVVLHPKGPIQRSNLLLAREPQ